MACKFSKTEQHKKYFYRLSHKCNKEATEVCNANLHYDIEEESYIPDKVFKAHETGV